MSQAICNKSNVRQARDLSQRRFPTRNTVNISSHKEYMIRIQTALFSANSFSANIETESFLAVQASKSWLSRMIFIQLKSRNRATACFESASNECVLCVCANDSIYSENVYTQAAQKCEMNATPTAAAHRWWRR